MNTVLGLNSINRQSRDPGHWRTIEKTVEHWVPAQGFAGPPGASKNRGALIRVLYVSHPRSELIIDLIQRVVVSIDFKTNLICSIIVH